MISPGGKRLQPSWRLALLLSLLLHGGAGLALALIPGPTPQKASANPLTLEVSRADWNQAEPGVSTYFIYPAPAGGKKAAGARKSPVDSSEDSENNREPAPFQAVLLSPDSDPTPKHSEAGAANSSPGSGDNPTEGTGNGPGAGPDNGPGADKGGTSFFQIETKAKRVVYVIDRSSSMGKQGALDTARRELLASLQKLPADASFQIIVYNSTAQPLMPAYPNWLPASELNKRLAAEALAQLESEGSTCHQLALPLALSMLPEVVFFLTDADDLTLAHVRQVTSQNLNKVAIHVIELNPVRSADPNMPLQVLARQNGGVYRAIGPANNR